MVDKCFYCGEKKKGFYEEDGLGNQFFCCEDCNDTTFKI
jgi:hypothetical protein